MTLKDVADKASQSKAIIAFVAMLIGGVVFGAEAVKNAQKVPTLEQLAQEQREANKVMAEQLKASERNFELQQRQLDKLIDIHLQQIQQMRGG